jgi:hypothetical protein
MVPLPNLRAEFSYEPAVRHNRQGQLVPSHKVGVGCLVGRGS